MLCEGILKVPRGDILREVRPVSLKTSGHGTSMAHDDKSYISVTDLGGAKNARPLSVHFFFIFMQFSSTIVPNNRLVLPIPSELELPLDNPGSATESRIRDQVHCHIV